MKKEISVVCHNFSADTRNGYGNAFGLYYILAQHDNVILNIIIPRDIDVYSEEEKFIRPNMKVRYIAPPHEIRADNQWGYFIKTAQDKTLQEKLRELTQNSDTVICDSVYYVSLTRAALPDKKIIYRSLDVEYDKVMYFRQYQNDNMSDDLLESTFALEKRACEDADVIWALTDSDADRMCELYKIKKDKITLLPICSVKADLNKMYIPQKRSHKVSKALIISNPRIDNAESFINAAANLPEIEFHLIGGCCYDLKNCSSNVILHGRVSDEQKEEIISECDFALNLSYMTFGMNVKMTDYFIGGIPVLANELGVRGYNVLKNVHYFHADFDSLENDIREFCKLSQDERYNMALNAFDHLCRNYNYRNYMYLIDEMITQPESEYDYFIFGAGQIGKMALKEIEGNSHHCAGFVDNDKLRHGELYYGKEIFPPEYVFDKIKKFPQKQKIVIAVGWKWIGEIVKQVLHNVDKSNVTIFEAYSSRKLIDLNDQYYDINKLLNYGG